VFCKYLLVLFGFVLIGGVIGIYIFGEFDLLVL